MGWVEKKNINATNAPASPCTRSSVVSAGQNILPLRYSMAPPIVAIINNIVATPNGESGKAGVAVRGFASTMR